MDTIIDSPAPVAAASAGPGLGSAAAAVPGAAPVPDGLVRVEVRAKRQNGRWRAKRHWGSTPTTADVTLAELAELEGDKFLRVNRLSAGSPAPSALVSLRGDRDEGVGPFDLEPSGPTDARRYADEHDDDEERETDVQRALRSQGLRFQERFRAALAEKDAAHEIQLRELGERHDEELTRLKDEHGAALAAVETKHAEELEKLTAPVPVPVPAALAAEGISPTGSEPVSPPVEEITPVPTQTPPVASPSEAKKRGGKG